MQVTLTPIEDESIPITLTPVDEKPEASWGEIITKAGKTVFPSIAGGAGGLIRAAEDLVPDSMKARDFKSLGKQTADYWENRIEENQPDVVPGSVKDYASKILQNVGQNVPTLAAGAMTGGAAVPLTAMGLQAGGQKYHQMREAGQTPGTSAVGAGIVGTSEAVTELLPFETLIKPGISFAKRLVMSTALDVPGELINTTIESAVDKVTITPDMTWEDYGKALADTAIITLGSAGLLTTISHPLVKAREKGEATTPAPPDQGGEPVTLTPVEEIMAEGEVNKREYQERIRAEKASEITPGPVSTTPALYAQEGTPNQGGEVEAPKQYGAAPRPGLGEVVGYNAKDGKPVFDMEASAVRPEPVEEVNGNNAPRPPLNLRGGEGENRVTFNIPEDPAPIADERQYLIDKFKGKSRDEQMQELYIDKNTGLYNERGFKLLPKKEYLARISISGVKPVNDGPGGHSAGDQMYRDAAYALKTTGEPIGKVGGDFSVWVNSREELDSILKKANENLPSIEAEPGKYMTGFEFTGAIGKNQQEADAAHKEMKNRLVESGARADRKVLPLNAREAAPRADLSHPSMPMREEFTRDYSSRTPEEHAVNHYFDRPGLLTGHGFRALPVPRYTLSMDADFLAIANEHGHDVADEIIAAIKDLGAELGGEISFAHDHGDEFIAGHNDEDVLRAYAKKLQLAAKDVILEIERKDGTVITKKGIGLSFGIGRTYELADKNLNINKQYKSARNQRNERVERESYTVTHEGISRPGDNGLPEPDTAGGQAEHLVQREAPPLETVLTEDNAHTKAFKDEVKERHPDLTEEDIPFVARQTAAIYDSIYNAVKTPIKKGAAAGNRDSMLHLAETGQVPLAKGGANKGKPKSSFEHAKGEFFKQAEIYSQEKARHESKAPQFGDRGAKALAEGKGVQKTIFGTEEVSSTKQAKPISTKEQPGLFAGEAKATPEMPEAKRVEERDTQTGEMFGEKPEKKEGIQDFGEKIAGARKDLAAAMRKEYSDNDLATIPLNKIWPADLSDKIEDPYIAAIAFAARAEIPAKPRVSYKVARWVEKVKTLRSLAEKMLADVNFRARAEAKLNEWKGLEGFKAKVTLLESIDRSQWGRIGKVEEHPNAYRYGEGTTRIPAPQVYVQIDGKTQFFEGASSVADVIEKVNEMLGVERQAAKMKFEVRGREGAYFINKAGDSEYRKLKTFMTSKEAIDYRNNNYDDLVAAWEGVKERDNVKQTDVRSPENRPRTAEDYRKGKDITTEEFADTFGFRGGQFGNWVSQGKNAKERQWMLNNAYDALMDLSTILKIPPKAVSLNGELGIAFGARGSGWASAHYESDQVVINLTKTRGAGTFAHEWFHALDNYFQRIRGISGIAREGRFITYKPEPLYVHKDQPTGQKLPKREVERRHERDPKSARFDLKNWIPDPAHPEGVRPEVEARFAELVEKLNDSPMAQRSAAIDKGRDGYWSRIIERAARAFENYVIAKMAQQGYHNDYLANVVSINEFKRDEGRYPYLKEEELAPVVEAFDNLFGTLETKETEKGVALLQIGKGLKASPEQIQDIIKEIERIAAPGVKVEAKDKIAIPPAQLKIALEKWGEGSEADIKIRGAHRVVNLDGKGFRSLIELSLENMGESTPYHEAFHSVQEFLLSDEEIRRLEERFPARDGVSSHERQAEAFAQYVAGREARYPVWAREIFAKIKEFLNSVRRYLKGQGLTSVNDIFERAFTGELRERAAGVSGAGEMSLDIDSDNFRKWFGNSKVVDENGKPMIMLHGTSSDFAEFDKLKIGSVFEDDKEGFSFTNNPGPDMASGYAERASMNGGAANVMPVYLKIENPLVIDSADELDGRGVVGYYDKYKKLLIAQAKEEGHDGIILKDPDTALVDGPYKSKNEVMAVVFEPKQIKSVFNRGTFDPDNSNISLDIEHRTVSATEKLINRINSKAADNVRIKGRKKDLGFVKGLIGSPGTIEGKARYYVVHAKNAVHKQDRLRGMIEEKMAEIFRPLKSKEQRAEFEALSWAGDAEGKTYTTAEMEEMGVSATVQDAYLKSRKFHDQVWRLLASHRKGYNGETGYREGHIPHLFENWNVFESTTPDPSLSKEGSEESKKIVGTFRSLKEATAFANTLSREKEYLIRPKTFRMPDELISKTVMKDISYRKMVENVEQAFELSTDEAKEMVSEVARRKSRRRFFGNVMQRTGQTGFRKDDLRQILKQYYNSTARYMALDDFKARVVPKFEKDFGVEIGRSSAALRDKNVARYVEEYINDVNGAPGMIEELLDSSIKNAFGRHIRSERPTVWAVNKALHATAVMKLGLLNLSAGLVNLSQLINTFSKVPASHFASAFDASFHPSDSDRAILRRIGVDTDLGLSDTGGYSKADTGGRLVKGSMFFFSWAERKNRVITALASYRHARKELGMGEQAARHYAREIIDKTQFDYSVADTARIFRNPAGRLLGQFKPYAIKEVEFMMGLKGAENVKFWIPILLMAGTAGVPLIEGISDFINWLTGKDPLTETKKFLMEWAGDDKEKQRAAEIAMYGVMSQVGIDISHRVGTGDMLPSRASDMLGPTLNTLMNAKELLAGDRTELVRSLAPSVGNVITAIETAMNGMEVADPYHRERLKYTATPGEVAAKGLGFRPMREAKLSDLEKVRRYETEHYDEAQKEYVDQAIDALKSGDAEGFADVVKKAAEEGVIVDDKAIENEMVQKLLPQELRTLLKTRNMLKGGQLDRMEFLD